MFKLELNVLDMKDGIPTKIKIGEKLFLISPIRDIRAKTDKPKRKYVRINSNPNAIRVEGYSINVKPEEITTVINLLQEKDGLTADEITSTSTIKKYRILAILKHLKISNKVKSSYNENEKVIYGLIKQPI